MCENNDIERRQFLKLGLFVAGGLCPFARSIFAADSEKKVKYEILKGNGCKRCLKMVEELLADEKLRKELDELFPDGKTVYMIYGRRVKIPDLDATISVGRCARTVKAPVQMTKGCPPSKEKIMSAIRDAHDKFQKSNKYKKKYKGLFGN